jgi:hypothetical protein
VDVTAVSFGLMLSPLVHVRSDTIEFVAGPKVGFSAARSEVKSGGATTSRNISGNLFGLNLGLFMNVSDSMAVGGLLSFDIRTIEHACIQEPRAAEVCGNATGDAAKVLGITAAALF